MNSLPTRRLNPSASDELTNVTSPNRFQVSSEAPARQPAMMGVLPFVASADKMRQTMEMGVLHVVCALNRTRNRVNHAYTTIETSPFCRHLKPTRGAHHAEFTEKTSNSAVPNSWSLHVKILHILTQETIFMYLILHVNLKISFCNVTPLSVLHN